MSSASLPVLLSQALVAFTIEFDNEFESRMSKSWARTFGVSMVMWSNFLRFVREEGVTVADVVASSCTPKTAVASVVGGTERWGYITVDHDPADGVAPPRKGFGSGRGVTSDTVIRPSMAGMLARELWETLPSEIEGRWDERLGSGTVDALRRALLAIQCRIEHVMPHFLPIVGGGGLFANADLEAGTSEPDDDLAALLSRILLAFTLDLEEGSAVSMPVGSNVLRVLSDTPTPLKDLPMATGVSKEAISMSMTWLDRAGYVTVSPDPSGRGKVVALASEGIDALEAYERVLGDTEKEWDERFGKNDVATLRDALLDILDRPGGRDGPLSAGLVTPPGGWRTQARYKRLADAFVESPRNGLPRYPMVLHRGGWPDGS